MIGFPLLLIPLAIYNIIAFLMPGVSLTDPLVKLTLMSGTEWPVTLSDVLLALGIFLLLLEIIKGARPGAKYLTDHLLSLIVFGAAAAEFVLWPKFGTSTYFLLALLALSDFLSGIAQRARRGQRAPDVLTPLIAGISGKELVAAVARERDGDMAAREAAEQVGRQDRRVAKGLIEPAEHLRQKFASVLEFQHLQVMAHPEVRGEALRVLRFIKARLREANRESMHLPGREHARGGSKHGP